MPLDTSVEHRVSTDDEHQVSTDDNGLFKALVNRLPESERSAFSRHQMEVMKSACKGLKWGAHPVDIRLSIPTLFNRFYVVILAGKERRGKARRSDEKHRHRFNRVSNYLFISLIMGLGLYLAIMIEALLVIAFYENMNGCGFFVL